nr:MAG TPA: hypothetical protein [Caudoviricetes sp.]
MTIRHKHVILNLSKELRANEVMSCKSHIRAANWKKYVPADTKRKSNTIVRWHRNSSYASTKLPPQKMLK